jgi:peptidoglycan hydrolase CwlO-like protein
VSAVLSRFPNAPSFRSSLCTPGATETTAATAFSILRRSERDVLNEFVKEHRKIEKQERKIQEQEATIIQLKKEMDNVVARLAHEDSKLQKVSAQSN